MDIYDRKEQLRLWNLMSASEIARRQPPAQRPNLRVRTKFNMQYAIRMTKLQNYVYDDKIPDEYCKGDREARLSFYYGMPSTGVYPNNAALSFTSKGQVALFDVA